MEGGGFEPPKASPTDLQSVPFGRSGTPPLSDRRLAVYHIQSSPPTAGGSRPESLVKLAGEGTRTPDWLITNQLLYQLSYAGIIKLYPRNGGGTVIMYDYRDSCQEN